MLGPCIDELVDGLGVEALLISAEERKVTWVGERISLGCWRSRVEVKLLSCAPGVEKLDDTG